jgi:hypothetical protein
MSTTPMLVCLTPVKDEAWILERFLAAAATWADVIIVADQGSADGSPAIARSHEKVVLVENRAEGYDESARQRLLLETARAHVPGPRILIALDADEALSADAPQTDEWRRMLLAAPGTVLRFDWANLLPPGDTAWIPPGPIPFGFVDDGAEHAGERIHSTRLPTPVGAPSLTLDAIKVLHLQYLDWERMKAKQRWYQCWERINHPNKRPVQIYRQYHRMDAFPPEQIRRVDQAWFEGYRRAGIDFKAVVDDPLYWWDEEIVRWFGEYGREHFRRIDIWDVEWPKLARRLGISDGIAKALADPRTAAERAVHRWLAATQGRADAPTTRWCQRALIPLGW